MNFSNDSLTYKITTSTNCQPLKVALQNDTTATIGTFSTDTVTIGPDAYSHTTVFGNPITVDYSKLMSAQYFTIKDSLAFKHIKEYVPDKVYGFTFNDDTLVKTVCCESDTFSLEYAFFLAIAKKLYKDKLTFEGILKKVDEIRYQKYYDKLVKDGIKLFKKIQKEEKEKEIEKGRKEHQKLRKQCKKQRRRDRQVEETIQIITEAIRRAKEEE